MHNKRFDEEKEKFFFVYIKSTIMNRGENLNQTPN